MRITKGSPTGPKVLWPSWRYDPETGEGQIFEKPEDVPEGWTDNWGDALRGAAGEAVQSAMDELKDLVGNITRQEMIDFLQAEKVQFAVTEKNEALAAKALPLAKAKMEQANTNGDGN